MTATVVDVLLQATWTVIPKQYFPKKSYLSYNINKSNMLEVKKIKTIHNTILNFVVKTADMKTLNNSH